MFFTPHFGRALSNCSDSILRAPEAPTLARCQAQGARKGRLRVCRRQQSMFNKLSESAWVFQGARSPIAATWRSGGTHAGAGVGNACGHIEANQSCGMSRCSCSPGHLCVCFLDARKEDRVPTEKALRDSLPAQLLVSRRPPNGTTSKTRSAFHVCLCQPFRCLSRFLRTQQFSMRGEHLARKPFRGAFADGSRKHKQEQAE